MTHAVSQMRLACVPILAFVVAAYLLTRCA